MTLFYTPDPQSCTLPENESQHAVKVMRMQEGDLFAIIDGKGGYYKAEITLAHPKRCAYRILETSLGFEARPTYIHLAIAPTKNMDRLEWFVEKAVEIGVDQISVFTSFHSERRVVKSERLNKIIISAAKQSIKAKFPILNTHITFKELVHDDEFSGVKCIAHCRDGQKFDMNQLDFSTSEVLMLIGPEGDFSEEEVHQAVNQGFIPVSLGKSRLRTETAGVYAVSILNHLMT